MDYTRYIFDTISMAVVGTALGVAAAWLFVFFAWSFPSKIWKLLGLIPTVGRGVPELILTIVIAQFVGVGTFAGALALGIGSFGVLTRVLGDLVASVPVTKVAALRSAGASKVQVFAAGVVPTIFQEGLAQLIFRLDINVRLATVIGLFGGGGLGLLLKIDLGFLDFQGALITAGIISLIILALEFVSIVSRRIGSASHRGSLDRPLLHIVLSGLILASAWLLAGWLSESFEQSRSQAQWSVLTKLLSPDFVTMGEELLVGVLETLAFSLTGSIFAFALALVLASFSANRFALNTWSSQLIRGIQVLLRSVPTAVLGLFALVFLGFGFWQTVAVISLGVGLYVTKLLTDAIDELPTDQTLGLSRVGSSRFQSVVITFCYVMRERLVDLGTFTLDLAFRYGVVMGAIGFGGLGSVMLDAARVFALETVSAALILAVVPLIFLELVTRQSKPRTTIATAESKLIA